MLTNEGAKDASSRAVAKRGANGAAHEEASTIADQDPSSPDAAVRPRRRRASLRGVRDPVRIKICGVTTVDDALACVEAGADAIGLNFWPESKRRCARGEAACIVRAVGDRVRVVGVFVDESEREIERVRAETGVLWAQLHGDEPPELLTALLPCALKAVRPRDAAEARGALRFGGEELLVDAAVAGMPGGTGQRCDWTLAADLARERKVWLAGGLRPGDVGEAIRAVRPFGVDVASGVERAPGEKDHDLVRAFVAAVRAAA